MVRVRRADAHRRHVVECIVGDRLADKTHHSRVCPAGDHPRVARARRAHQAALECGLHILRQPKVLRAARDRDEHRGHAHAAVVHEPPRHGVRLLAAHRAVAPRRRLALGRHAHTHEVRGRAALRLKPVLRASEDDEARGGEGTLAPQLELEEAEPEYFRV